VGGRSLDRKKEEGGGGGPLLGYEGSLKGDVRSQKGRSRGLNRRIPGSAQDRDDSTWI